MERRRRKKSLFYLKIKAVKGTSAQKNVLIFFFSFFFLVGLVQYRKLRGSLPTSTDQTLVKGFKRGLEELFSTA